MSETIKLYEHDSHLCAFDAMVLSCVPQQNAYAVVLDRTAFYPLGGGQPADRGQLGDVRVIDVRNQSGCIVHLTDAPLSPGELTHGEIDWPYRRMLMQQHSGEHIVSGLIHSRFGYDNTGFHMGAASTVIDFSGPISAEQLQQIECAANEVIYQNLPVLTQVPSEELRTKMQYRSKIPLRGRVRIVQIPGVDQCACCGTHVKYTGEIGLIHLFAPQKHKGGTRFQLLCGDKALRDYQQKDAQIASLSSLLSAKPEEVYTSASHLREQYEKLRRQVDELALQVLRQRVEQIDVQAPLLCCITQGLTPVQLRQYCLLLCEKATQVLVISGSDATGYQYAWGSLKQDARSLHQIWAAQCGARGGGTQELLQGKCNCPRTQMEQALLALQVQVQWVV